MTTLNLQQVYALAREAGLGQAAATIAAGLTIPESGMVTDKLGDLKLQTAVWGPSVGLWQIRSVKAESGKGTTRDATRLTDPRFNARSMVAISGGGKNWKPWSTYQPDTIGYQRNFRKAQVAAADSNISGGLSDAAGSVGGAVSGAAGAVAGAATDAAKAAAGAVTGAFTTGWGRDANGLVIKAAFVTAGAALVILGVWRLVLPAAASTIGKVL